MAPAVAVPRRWLSEDMQKFVPVQGEPVRQIDPDKVDAVATAAVHMPDGEYSAVLVIEGGERFLTILTADEGHALRDAVISHRQFLQFDSQNGAIRVEGIRFFE